MTIAGFVHGTNGGGDPCQGDDGDLIFVERYVGVESRRIHDLLWNRLILSADALSDETESTVEQYIECRYCDGAHVPIPDYVTVEYE